MLKVAAPSSAAAPVAALGSFQVVIPMRSISISQRAAMLCIFCKIGLLYTVRIHDSSVIGTARVDDRGVSLVEWSLEGDRLYVYDESKLVEYSADGLGVLSSYIPATTGRKGKLLVSKEYAALVNPDMSLEFLPIRSQSIRFLFKSWDSYRVIDYTPSADGLFVIHKDDVNTIRVIKFTGQLEGNKEGIAAIQTEIALLEKNLAGLVKNLKLLEETLAKWRSAAFLDFDSLNQLVHFLAKYDSTKIKRDAGELQRLEIVFKTTLENISEQLCSQDEDALQSLGEAISRLSVLLRGADDLELMTLGLSDVISYLRVLSVDFGALRAQISSKVERKLEEQQALLATIPPPTLWFIRSFEYALTDGHLADVACVNHDLYAAVVDDGRCQLTLFRNGDRLLETAHWRCSLVHIASPSMLLVLQDASLYAVGKGQEPRLVADGFGQRPDISGRDGIVTIRRDDYSCSVYDLTNLF